VTLRLATYNIRKGGRRRSHLIAEVLRSLDPDLIVLQEAVDPWVVGTVAREVGAQVVTSAPGRSVAVLSRIGGLETAWHHPAGGPWIAEIELPSISARLLGLHLSAGLSSRGERRRAREIEHVLAVAGARRRLSSVLIAGDLNAVAPGDLPAISRLPSWIRLLLRVDGGISTIGMERLLSAGLVDAYRRINPSSPGATIPSGAPSVRLDYFLVGADLAPQIVGCRVATANPTLLVAASDHLPLVLDLDNPPA
jgi:endonuclease/exonuclease/phosphatase family metal-dependent hydrolase